MNIEKLDPEIRKQLEASFSPELIEKVKACKSAQDVFDLLDNEDIKLTEDQLELVSGGNLQQFADVRNILACAGPSQKEIGEYEGC